MEALGCRGQTDCITTKTDKVEPDRETNSRASQPTTRSQSTSHAWASSVKWLLLGKCYLAFFGEMRLHCKRHNSQWIRKCVFDSVQSLIINIFDPSGLWWHVMCLATSPLRWATSIQFYIIVQSRWANMGTNNQPQISSYQMKGYTVNCNRGIKAWPPVDDVLCILVIFGCLQDEAALSFTSAVSYVSLSI